MNEQTWLQRLDELIAAIHARVDADQNPILTERFQFEELQVLAFDLDVIDASIRRTNKLVFALDLFQYMQQRDALGQIIKNRPTVDGVANLRAIQARPTAGKPPTNSVGLAANSTRPPLVVDQMHRGDHATIGAATQAAKPGDVIAIHPDT